MLSDQNYGQAQWLTPVMPVLGEAEVGGLFQLHQPGQHSDTLSLLKNKKLAGRGGSCLQSQHFGKPRRADHLSPGVRDQPG